MQPRGFGWPSMRLPCTLTVLTVLAGCGETARWSADEPPPAAIAAHAPAAMQAAPQAPVLPLDRPLDEDALIAAVLARNPSLVAMQAGYRMAEAQDHRESAIPEPTLSYDLAPMSLHEPTPGMQVTLSQPVPWPSRLRAGEQAARAEADAAGDDVSSTRLQLVEEAQHAFADYWLATSQLEVNRQERTIDAQISASALSAYGAGAGDRTAVLQAQSMVNELDHHAILFERGRNIAIARLNLLLHRPSDAPVPPPPDRLAEPGELPDERALARLAVEHRPDLAAAAARRRQAVAMEGLARAQDLPDVSVSVGYSTMWTDPAMRFTVGVEVPLPVDRDRQAAIRDEAKAGVQRADAELLMADDQLQFDVREAHERLVEGWHILHLLRTRMIPTSEAMVASAQSEVAGGGRAYSGLLGARKELIEMHWQEQQAIADVHHRLADLERIVGGQLPQTHTQPARQELP